MRALGLWQGWVWGGWDGFEGRGRWSDSCLRGSLWLLEGGETLEWEWGTHEQLVLCPGQEKADRTGLVGGGEWIRGGGLSRGVCFEAGTIWI